MRYADKKKKKVNIITYNETAKNPKITFNLANERHFSTFSFATLHRAGFNVPILQSSIR